MVTSVRLTADEADTFPTLLRTVVGSEVHGTGLPGLGDVDHMAIAVPDPSAVLGLDEPPESWAHRTAWTRESDDPAVSARSGVGDLDLIIYPARKWARLAHAGNPSALTPLFVGDQWLISSGSAGEELRANRHRFIARHVVTKHLGYMTAQRQRMLGEGNMKVHRPELVDAHGFDVKFASHMLRLGHQGLAVLTEGDLPVPLPPEIAERILAVRRGERELADVVEEAAALEAKIVSGLDTTALPEWADGEWLNSWLARIHIAEWA